MSDRTVSRALLIAAALAAFAAGCSPTVDLRGNLPNAEQLALIKPGVQNRDDVANLLGTPSSTAPFTDETWYYISSRTETVAFLSPKELERKVVAIEFDKNGLVREVKSYGMDDGMDIKPVARETPTAGKEINLIQQLLGNLGKFNKEPGGKPAGTPGG